MASDNTVLPSRTTATAVSSQEDSKASIFMLSTSFSYSSQGTWEMGGAAGSRGIRTYLAYLAGENRLR